MVMMRRWHLAATTHQMAAVPDTLAHNAWMRLGSDRRERHDKHGEQDERHEFAHGSFLEQSRVSVSGEQEASRCGQSA